MLNLYIVIAPTYLSVAAMSGLEPSWLKWVVGCCRVVLLCGIYRYDASLCIRIFVLTAETYTMPLRKRGQYGPTK